MKLFLRMAEVLLNISKVDSVIRFLVVQIKFFDIGFSGFGSGDGGQSGLGFGGEIGFGYRSSVVKGVKVGVYVRFDSSVGWDVGMGVDDGVYR